MAFLWGALDPQSGGSVVVREEDRGDGIAVAFTDVPGGTGLPSTVTVELRISGSITLAFGAVGGDAPAVG